MKVTALAVVLLSIVSAAVAQDSDEASKAKMAEYGATIRARVREDQWQLVAAWRRNVDATGATFVFVSKTRPISRQSNAIYRAWTRWDVIPTAGTEGQRFDYMLYESDYDCGSTSLLFRTVRFISYAFKPNNKDVEPGPAYTNEGESLKWEAAIPNTNDETVVKGVCAYALKQQTTK